MSNNASFVVFFSDDSKKLVTVKGKHLRAPERYFWVLLENGNRSSESKNP